MPNLEGGKKLKEHIYKGKYTGETTGDERNFRGGDGVGHRHLMNTGETIGVLENTGEKIGVSENSGETTGVLVSTGEKTGVERNFRGGYLLGHSNLMNTGETIGVLENTGEIIEVSENTGETTRVLQNTGEKTGESRNTGGVTEETWKKRPGEIEARCEVENKNQSRGTRRRQKTAKKKNKLQVRMNKICLLYNNVAGKTRREWEALEEVVKTREADIVCLTETHWKEGYGGKKLQGYKSFVKNRGPEEKKGGGVAIFVREDIKSYERELKKNDAVAVTIKTAGGFLTIVNVYMSTDKREHHEQNRELLHSIKEEMVKVKREGGQLLMVGDMNAHIQDIRDQVDGGHRTNINGKLMQELMEEMELVQVNGTSKCKGRWTWGRRDKKSVIDYVIADKEVFECIEKMWIDDDGIITIGSDHNFIEVTIEMMADRKQTEYEPNWKICSDTPWENFQREYEKNRREIETGEQSCDDMAEKITRDLKNAAELIIGKKKRGKRNEPKKIKKLREKRNRLSREWKEAQKSKSIPEILEAWDKYITAQRDLAKK